MADIRINALATTAASTASDDFVAVDGSANGTRKLNAYSPTFGGNLTVSGTGTSSVAGSLILGASSSAVETAWTASGYAGHISFPDTSQFSVFSEPNSGYRGGGLACNVARVGGGWSFVDSTKPAWRVYFGNGSFVDNFTINRSGATTYSESTLFQLTSTGNLLIGTTTDGGQKLQVNGTGYFAGTVTVGAGGTGSTQATTSINGGSASGGGAFVSLARNSVIKGYFSTESALIGNTSDDIALYAVSGGSVKFYTNGLTTEVLKLTSTGAANFGGAVTIGADGIGGGGANKITLNYEANASSRSWRLINDAAAFGDFAIQQSTTRTGSTYANALLIDSSLNATFAGSLRVEQNSNLISTTRKIYGLDDATNYYIADAGLNGLDVNWYTGTRFSGSSGVLGRFYGTGGLYIGSSPSDPGANNLKVQGSVTTGTPSGGTAGAWKLGVRVAATTTLDTTQYLQVDIGGTLYKVALVTS